MFAPTVSCGCFLTDEGGSGTRELTKFLHPSVAPWGREPAAESFGMVPRSVSTSSWHWALGLASGRSSRSSNVIAVARPTETWPGV